MLKTPVGKFFFLVILACFCLPKLTQSQTTVDNVLLQERIEEIELFYRVYDTIKEYYPKDSATSSATLIKNALRGMVNSLDPYSHYLDQEAYANISSERSEEIAGVGISLAESASGARIVAVLPGSPAEAAGLRVGEYLLSVDNKSVSQLNIPEIVQLLRGKVGSNTLLELADQNFTSFRKLEIKRSSFRIPSISSTHFISGEPPIGYIKVAFFNDDANKDFSRALNHLTSQGIRGLVIDLRGNPGGSIDAAVSISSHFLKPHSVISRLAKKNGIVEELRPPEQTLRFLGPVAVLIDAGTASAAEMLASALREHRRAVLCGERSFGKGSLQNLFELPDGSGLRLTTAFYLTPSGKTIEGTGINPDIEVKHQSTSNAPALNRSSGINRNNLESEINDEALRRAIDALRAVIVHLNNKQEEPQN